MQKKNFIFLICFFINCFAVANSNVEVFFYVNGSLTNMPSPILETLQETPNTELDQKIIKKLIQTSGYDNVAVKEYKDSNDKIFFVVSGIKTQKIHKVILHGIDDTVLYQAEHLINDDIGQIYTQDVVLNLERRIEKLLKESGYRNAKIEDVQASITDDDQFDLDVYVNTGRACIIQQFVMPTGYLNFLKFFTFPLDIGSPCDKRQIEDALLQIQENYVSEGYLQASITIDRIEYTQNEEKAIVYIKVDIGNKTVLKIRQHPFNLFKSEIFDPRAGGLTYSDLISMSDTELRNIITDFYQNQGYTSVRTSSPKRFIDKNGDNIISFDVVKGPPSKINKIFFLGDPLPLSENGIQAEMGLRPGLSFNKNDLQEYKEKFKKILLRYGYNDSVVNDFDFYFSSNKTRVNIIITYERNTQFIVSSIQYDGLPESIQALKNKFAFILKPSDPVNIVKKEEISAQLIELLLTKGYLYAQVKSKTVFNKKTPPDLQTQTQIIYEVIPGPVVTIGNIEVVGDTFHKEDTIKSISNLKMGDVFTQTKLDDAVEEILAHVLFTSVAIDFKDPKILEKQLLVADLVIHVRGRKGLNFSLSPAYGTGTGYRANLNFNVNNLTPHGLRLTFDVYVRREIQQQVFDILSSKQILGQSYTIGLVEPLFKFFSLQTPIDLSLLGNYQVTTEILTNRSILGFNLLGVWNPTLYGVDTMLSVALDQTEYKSLSPVNNAVVVFDSPYIMLRNINTKLSFDTRNDQGWPTNGSLIRGLFGFGLFGFGSDVQYNNFNFNIKQYFPIYKKLSGAVYFGVSQTNGVKNKNPNTITPPENLRNYLIEDSIIRGLSDNYIYNSQGGPMLWLHPADTLNGCSTNMLLIGGSQMIYLKMEARYRINNNFGLVLFGDSGTTYLTSKEMNEIKKTLGSLTTISSPGSQCVFDQAALVPVPSINSFKDFFTHYLKKSYIATGPGVRVILGRYMTINLDYGYPVFDPSQLSDGCSTIKEANNASTPPLCVNRTQKSVFIFNSIKYKGAVHFTVEATLY